MKDKKIMKDILKLHPELEQDKDSLKKTVKFLSAIEPKIVMDQKFRSDLGKRLSVLASIKSSGVEDFSKKPGILHIFSGVFASLLAFFGLFYVFGDTLFYIGETPVISEYEAQISDIDVIQETKLEIRSTGGMDAKNKQTTDTVEIIPRQGEVPSTIFIDTDGASQEDVSQPQKIQIEKNNAPKMETQTIEDSFTENNGFKDTSSDESTSQDEVEDFGVQTDFGAEVDMMISPAAGSMMAPEMNSDDDILEDVLDTIEEEVIDDVLDEFTLRCDVFGGEVSIKDEIRVCNIGDIVCTETDFLKGVCELGQE